jgi:hypothetical protein
MLKFYMDTTGILKYILCFIIIFNNELLAQNSFVNQYTANVSTLKGYSCVEAKDGTYLLAAFGFSVSALDDNLLILKMNGTGDTLWTKFYDLSIPEEIPRDIMATADSGFIVSGDGFIMKAGMDGNTEWIKLTNTRSVKWIESIPEGYAFCLSDMQGSPIYNYILKTDFAGNFLSAFNMSGGVQNWLYQIDRLISGDYAVSAALYSHTTPFAYLLLTDSNMNVKSFLYGEGNNMRCMESNDHDLILTYAGDAGDHVLKMDTVGNIKWIKYFDAGYYPASIDTITDGGVVISGNYFWLGDSASLFVSRFDSTGNLVQTDLFCCYDDKALVRSTSDGGYITFLTDSLYQRGIDFVKHGPLGSTSCVQSGAGSSSTALQIPQYFVSSPLWFGSTTLPLLDDTAIVYSGCNLSRLCISTEITHENFRPNQFQVVPNPVSDKFRIVFGDEFLDCRQFTIYDLLGNIIIASALDAKAQQIDLSSIRDGIYFVELLCRDQKITKRIAKITK